MRTSETENTPLTDSNPPAADGITRRDFVERLRRAAIFLAPVVASVTLMTPKARGSA